MKHDLRVYESVEELATASAAFVTQLLRDRDATKDPFTFALSGGRSPWLMLSELAHDEIAWKDVTIFQVDERAVPADDDLRNVKHIREALGSTRATIEPMDVENPDLDAASREYATKIPTRFDLIHLGLGPDGHCASLVPNDPVLAVSDRLVAPSGPYQDTMRMTLTYPALHRANQLLWLVSGEDKVDALAKLLDGDESIPAGRVEAAASMVMADRAALPA
ncbi:MAG: 6-phosphogluconolactonase [Acidimicrobiaceae bacterium]|nr:6-phosphogluconolactonase [Acidimicrobiaceae bacterium]